MTTEARYAFLGGTKHAIRVAPEFSTRGINQRIEQELTRANVGPETAEFAATSEDAAGI